MIALLLALAGAGQAAATKQTVRFVTAYDERKEVAVVCPVDGTKFTAYRVVRSNRLGGQDFDWCYHALKTTPLEHWIWVCPSCAFAGQEKDFEAKLGEEEKKALVAGLKPAAAIRKGAPQTEIPGHVKFDLLAQVSRLRKAPPEQVGLALLHASWSCRQQGAISFSEFDEWDALLKSYGLDKNAFELGIDKATKLAVNRTVYELDIVKRVEKDIEGKKYERGANRTLARYLAAYLHRRHGENVDALRCLGEVDRVKGENSVVDDAAARMRASIDLERVYQKKAIDAYVEAIDGKKLSRRLAAETAYLLGELFRRLGERDSARSWYQTAIETTEIDEFRKLAADQKAKLGP